MNRLRIDGLTIVSIALLLFMVYSVLTDNGMVEPTMASALVNAPGVLAPSASNPQAVAIPKVKKGINTLFGQPTDPAAVDPSAIDPAAAPAIAQPPAANLWTQQQQEAIAPPYKQFVLTQGLHSSAYDKNAIDIEAGKGTTIISPINGVVSKVFVDQFGNTTIEIENDVYRVTMLHGNYTAKPGEVVTEGQPVGTESNHGLTFDGTGRSCQNRNCGWHTHINIFDKRTNTYANPLELLKIP